MLRLFKMEISLITAAFGWRPEPSSYVESSQLARYESDQILSLVGREWTFLTGDYLEANFEALYLLTPEAFCYFLPGIIAAGIEENEPNLIVNHALVGMLDTPASTPCELDQFAAPRLTRLTKSELDVVECWLWWLSEHQVSNIYTDKIMRAVETVEMLRRNVK